MHSSSYQIKYDIKERERERVKICIKKIINERRQEFGEEGKKGILFVLLN
jgi:hypothetical protein